MNGYLYAIGVIAMLAFIMAILVAGVNSINHLPTIRRKE